MPSDANYGLDSLVSAETSLRREYLEKRQLEILKILKKNDLAVPGWENVVQPWNEHVCKKWISWGHILRYWEIAQREKLAKEYRAPIKWCTHDRYKMELIEAYKKFHKNDMDEETLIPYWLAAMVFAKLFLNCAVDWKISDKKHIANKNIRQTFTKQTPQPIDDAEKATPQVPSVHVTSSKNENEDDMPLSQLLAQIRVKGKRPFNPSKDDEDESLSIANFRRIKRGPRDSIGDNEDAIDQGVPHDHTIITHDVQEEVIGPSEDEAHLGPQHPLHVASQAQFSMAKQHMQTQNEEIAVLQDLISRLCGDIYKEQFEKQVLYEKMEELKKENEEEKAVLQAEMSKLKEEKAILQGEASRLQEGNTDLQAQISRLEEDLQKEVKTNGEDKLKIQGLEEVIKKMKNEKRMIVQLDESQFDKITNLISHTL